MVINSINVEYGHKIVGRMNYKIFEENLVQSKLTEYRIDGINEGYADSFAIFLNRTNIHTPFTNFVMVAEDDLGRYKSRNKYTCDININKIKFSDINNFVGDYHDVGEVWATMMNQV